MPADHVICLRKETTTGGETYIRASSGLGTAKSDCTAPGGNLTAAPSDKVHWYSDGVEYWVTFGPHGSPPCPGASCWACTGPPPNPERLVVDASHSTTALECKLRGHSVYYGVESPSGGIPLDPVIVIVETREPMIDLTLFVVGIVIAAVASFGLARSLYRKRG